VRGKQTKSYLSHGWGLLAILLPLLTWAEAAPDITLGLENSSRTFFGGRHTALNVVVTAEEEADGVLTWELAIGQRTIRRGEKRVVATRATPAVVELTMPFPPVKPGVVISPELRLSLRREGRTGPAVDSVETLRLFPENPFADRREGLEKNRLALFDPTGKTEQILRDSDVPYEYVRTPLVLESDDKPRTLIVGSGLSFDDYPELMTTLVRLAALGHAVLCLRPAGRFTMPGSDGSEGASPQDVRLAQSGIISELDKQLDLPPWDRQGSVVTTRCRFAAERALVVCHVEAEAAGAAGAAGWPWVNMRFQGTGRLLVSGLPIVESWESGPTPRFLFLRILELLAEPRQNKGD
jgi:hypothetical protein